MPLHVQDVKAWRAQFIKLVTEFSKFNHPKNIEVPRISTEKFWNVNFQTAYPDIDMCIIVILISEVHLRGAVYI